jgi:hypothetical protein
MSSLVIAIWGVPVEFRIVNGDLIFRISLDFRRPPALFLGWRVIRPEPEPAEGEASSSSREAMP